MILQVSADAPLILRLAAGALLVTHIAGGATGIVAGSVAMATRKGSPVHRAAGNAFFAGMLCMTIVGFSVAPFLPKEQFTNTTAGVFTFYLVVTGWLTARRPAGTLGLTERLAMVLPLGIVVEALAFAGQGFPRGPGNDYVATYVFGALSALALVCDARMLRAGGVTGPSRLARHLWRISAALFVAMGSFFLGQQKVLPAEIRGTLIPMLPVFAVIAAGVFWMIRIRFPALFRPRRPATA